MSYLPGRCEVPGCTHCGGPAVEDKPAAPLLTKELAQWAYENIACFNCEPADREKTKALAKFLCDVADGATVCVPAVAAPEGPTALLNRIILDLENGFVRCNRCGDQEDTATLDCMSDLRELRAMLAAANGKWPETAVVDAWIRARELWAKLGYTAGCCAAYDFFCVSKNGDANQLYFPTSLALLKAAEQKSLASPADVLAPPKEKP